MNPRRETLWQRRTLLAFACLALLLLPVCSQNGSTARPVAEIRAAHGALPPPGSLQITSFSYSPGTSTVGSQVQGNIQVSGGTTPYHAWLNNTPPGCQPSMVPYVTSNASTTFGCRPSSAGTYNVHLDVLDSAAPPARASQTASLTVNSNSGNGNGSGNGSGKSNGSGFSLPAGLLPLLTTFVFVFLGAIVALAAGVIAVAVSISRGMRKLNATIAAQQKPTSEGKQSP